MSSNHNWKQLLICYGLRELEGGPGARGNKLPWSRRQSLESQKHLKWPPSQGQLPCLETAKRQRHSKRTRTETTTGDPGEILCLSEWDGHACRNNRQVNHAAQKVRPGHTTFAAWCKWSIRDSNWRLVHQQRLHHEWISSYKTKSLSSGRRATWAMEFNSMPKTSKQEDGPIHLSGWRGSPNTLQAANDFGKLSSHWLDSGGPAVMKSSK